MRLKKLFGVLSDFCVNFAAGLAFAAVAIPLASSGSVFEKGVVMLGDITFAVAFLFFAYRMKI